MAGKKLLLTGSTGFIGAQLNITLSKAAQHTTVLALRSARADLAENAIAVGELNADTQWEEALSGVECAIHLAARAHIMNDSVADPLAAFRQVNTEGTLNFARQAAEAGVKRFIFLSSIKVNGEQTQGNQRFSPESSLVPDDPYGISKYEAEQGLRKIAAETGMEVVIIRPPLVYGPGVKGNLRQLMQWMDKGVPLPLGSIQNKRSLVALDNLVDLIITCIDHPNAANQTFLASDDHDISTTELLQGLSKGLDKPARLLPVPQVVLENGLKLLGKGDIAQRLCGNLQVDISKTKELLGWTPPVAVEEALLETAQAWAKAKQKAPN